MSAKRRQTTTVAVRVPRGNLSAEGDITIAGDASADATAPALRTLS